MKIKETAIPTQFLRLSTLVAELGISRATIYRLMKVGFPKPLKVGKRALAWRADEVHAFIAGCERSSTGDAGDSNAE